MGESCQGVLIGINWRKQRSAPRHLLLKLQDIKDKKVLKAPGRKEDSAAVGLPGVSEKPLG